MAGIILAIIIAATLVYLRILSRHPPLPVDFFHKKTESTRINASNDVDTKDGRKTKVLLVTAHPDDECMFFAPTIIAMTSNSRIEFHVLCLSNGSRVFFILC